MKTIYLSVWAGAGAPTAFLPFDNFTEAYASYVDAKRYANEGDYLNVLAITEDGTDILEGPFYPAYESIVTV